MIDTNNIYAVAHVVFKSTPENWIKEKSGRKPNTLRKLDDDVRFALLREGIARDIFIQNTETGEEFHRKITDYTEYDGYAIISWQAQK